MDLFDFPAVDLGSASMMTGTSTVTTGLYHAKIRLYQTDLAIDKNLTLATLNSASATFAGYGDQTITWAAPSIAEDGTIEAIGTTPAYRPTDAVTPNNIFGLYLVNQNGDLMFAGRFDGAPVPLVNTLSQLTVTLRFRPQSASIGSQLS
jgi:hypothetical protein